MSVVYEVSLQFTHPEWRVSVVPCNRSTVLDWLDLSNVYCIFVNIVIEWVNNIPPIRGEELWTALQVAVPLLFWVLCPFLLSRPELRKQLRCDAASRNLSVFWAHARTNFLCLETRNSACVCFLKLNFLPNFCETSLSHRSTGSAGKVFQIPKNIFWASPTPERRQTYASGLPTAPFSIKTVWLSC